MTRFLRSTLVLNCGLLWMFLGSELPLFSQLPTGGITGSVRDSSGAVIPGATVTATDRETGLARTAETSTDGYYKFAALPVGVYDVKAEAVSFSPQIQQALKIEIGQEAVLNFTLTVGAVQEAVTVTAAAPLVDTTSGSLGGASERVPSSRAATERPQF